MADAKRACDADSGCAGFTYQGPRAASGVLDKIYLKGADTHNTDANWSAYTKQGYDVPLWAVGMQVDTAAGVVEARGRAGEEGVTGEHGGGSGARVVLVVSKSPEPQSVLVDGAGGALASVLEGVGAEPGFAPPVSRRMGAHGELHLGPFAVALVYA